MSKRQGARRSVLCSITSVDLMMTVTAPFLALALQRWSWAGRNPPKGSGFLGRERSHLVVALLLHFVHFALVMLLGLLLGHFVVRHLVVRHLFIRHFLGGHLDGGLVVGWLVLRMSGNAGGSGEQSQHG